MPTDHEQLHFGSPEASAQSVGGMSEAIDHADIELPGELALTTDEQAKMKRYMQEAPDFLATVQRSVSYKKYLRIAGWLQAKKQKETLEANIANRPKPEDSHPSVAEMTELVRDTFSSDKAA